MGSKCFVSIVPSTANGTKTDADSGMKGVYVTLSSDLTLNGTPKDAGSYLVSVHIEDNQGRTADSNALPFRIYTGEETLADQIKVENLKQYQSGLYAWDIMEPWAIKNFGSNVDGEENSVRVPEKLEVWYGSHESGTYGVLGYDIPWDDVKASNIPQTLYIPNGCNLTLMNMKILSSVRIVVENGGKLTLRDSTVQGINSSILLDLAHVVLAQGVDKAVFIGDTLDIAGDDLDTQRVHVGLGLGLHLVAELLTVIADLFQSDGADDLTHVALQGIHDSPVEVVLRHIQEVLHGQLDALRVRHHPHLGHGVHVHADEVLGGNVTLGLDVDGDLADDQLIFIDELDRCKPDYAIRLLERIKHYFDDERITFVFSVNLTQLQWTVKGYYGSSFDATGYLEKFFDFFFTVPRVDSVRFLWNSMNLDTDSVTGQMCVAIIKQFNFSMRQMERYIRVMKIIEMGDACENARSRRDKATAFVGEFVIPLLIGLQMHDLDMYHNFRIGKDPTPLVNILASIDAPECKFLLCGEETFVADKNMSPMPGGTHVIKKDRVIEVYNAIFSKTGGVDVGQMTFSDRTREYLYEMESILIPDGNFDFE